MTDDRLMREFPDSVPWHSLKSFANQQMSIRKIEVEQQLPDDWSVKIGGFEYPELWLRNYAMMRHFHRCMVLASDYANNKTGVFRPIVRSHARDMALLRAHAEMARQCPKPVRRAVESEF